MSKVIKGKKVTTPADKIAADIKKLGLKGVGLQKEAIKTLGQDPRSLVSTQIGRQEKLARQSGEDAKMRARKMAAQRGLGASSIGAGMEQQASQRVADKLQDIRSQRGQLERGFAQEKFNLGSGLIGQRGPIKMQSTTVRKGGLGKVLGMAAGAALGGMAGQPGMGAKMGASIGGALQDS